MHVYFTNYSPCDITVQFLLRFRRCIIGLCYFSLKPVNNGNYYCSLRQLMIYTRIIYHLPDYVHIFVYSDSHLALNHQ